MCKAILHIGIGKTGSSSLQTYLSSGALDESCYEYCAIEPTGQVISGPLLTKRASRNAFKYVASTLTFNDVDHQKVRAGLSEICKRGKIPILSQEHWSALGAEFEEGRLLDQWGITDAHVIAYVRPQPEFLNAGWWQWWAWSGKFEAPTDLVEKWGVGFMHWYQFLRPYASLNGVHNLSVRLHGQDTVTDFLKIIGVENIVIDGLRKNAGMNRQLIQLYRAIPELRTELGSEVDSCLATLLDAGGSPWIVPPVLVQQVVRQCHEDNLSLLGLLPEDQQLQMRNNSRWWSAEGYENLEEVKPMCLDVAVSILKKIVPTFVELSRNQAR